MIIFIHLYNDRSGSPKVLSNVINLISQSKKNDIRLYVGSQGAGFLSDVNVNTKTYRYKRYSNRIQTLFSYLFSQIYLFFQLLFAKDIPQNAIIYVNTLLPFGAALYGKLTSKKVIYHIHEISVTPNLLKWFLTTIAKYTAKHLIYVSKSHQEKLPISKVEHSIVHNVLDDKFISQSNLHKYKHYYDGQFNVLMLSSIRDYKGVPELVTLAKKLRENSNITFHLVANDDSSVIENYMKTIDIPNNLIIHPRSNNTVEFYSKASLVMNLSRPDICVETFGLTILEAMTFSVPVIAPPVGGPKELCIDGKQGYLIDSRETDILASRILDLATNEQLCLEMSYAANSRAEMFSISNYKKDILNIISSLSK